MAGPRIWWIGKNDKNRSNKQSGELMDWNNVLFFKFGIESSIRSKKKILFLRNSSEINARIPKEKVVLKFFKDNSSLFHCSRKKYTVLFLSQTSLATNSLSPSPTAFRTRESSRHCFVANRLLDFLSNRWFFSIYRPKESLFYFYTIERSISKMFEDLIHREYSPSPRNRKKKWFKAMEFRLLAAGRDCVIKIFIY